MNRLKLKEYVRLLGNLWKKQNYNAVLGLQFPIAYEDTYGDDGLQVEVNICEEVNDNEIQLSISAISDSEMMNGREEWEFVVVFIKNTLQGSGDIKKDKW